MNIINPRAITTPPSISLKNNQAEVEVFLLGAGVHDYRFKRKNGEYFNPLAEAEWVSNNRTTTHADIDPHLQVLGGEWPCVPFGTSQYDEDHHGFSSNNDWHIVHQISTAVTLKIDYPKGHKIKHLIREIVLDDQGQLNFSLEVSVNEPCQLPIGLHPIFKIPENAGGLKITPPNFQRCASAPQKIAPQSSRFQAEETLNHEAKFWQDLHQSSDNHSESLLQAFKTDGQISLYYSDEKCHVTLDWEKDAFPHCLFWIANAGLRELPLGDGFYGLGIEPTNSFFDKNDLAKSYQTLHGLNAEEFGMEFSPKTHWKTHYKISCKEE